MHSCGMCDTTRYCKQEGSEIRAPDTNWIYRGHSEHGSFFLMHLNDPQRIVSHTQTPRLCLCLPDKLFFYLYVPSQFQLRRCGHLLNAILHNKPKVWSHIYLTSHILSPELCNSHKKGLNLLLPQQTEQ